ncbi:MAG: YfhO family protein [Patescibacteria group bacterium]|nr:YfhO family protein [Patescibacteria group bacterium]
MDRFIRSLYLFFKKKEIVFVFLVFFLISSIFFNKTFTKGYIPFPGDLIVGGYAPYNSYSFLGFAPGGYPNKAQDFDVIKLLYPAKYFSIDSFKNWQIPLWNPYNFSGNPHLASLQSGSFYPFNILFLIFPFNFSWTLYIYLQPFLAGFFAFLLLREFKLNIKSSIFGAIAFAFSSYFVVWMEYGNIDHSIIWLPLLFLLTLKNIKKPAVSKSILIILLLTFSILAGYIQVSFYVFIFLFAFYIFNLFSSKKGISRSFLILIPIFVLPFFLSLFQLLPMFELLNESNRTSYSSANFIKLLIPFWHAITLFVPDFFGNPATRNYWVDGTYIERVSYIGILPIFFALFVFLKKRSSIVWFFSISLFTTFLFSFDTIFSRLFYSLNLPFISTAVPTRIMFIFCFSASILAAFGFDSFEKNKEKLKSLFIPVVLIGVVYLSLWSFIFFAPRILNGTWISNLSISRRNLMLSSIIFASSLFLIFLYIRFNKFKKYVIILFFLLTIFDLYYFFQKITPFSPIESIYPKTEVLSFLKSKQGIDRSWGYGTGYIESDIQTYEKIYSTDGYDALHIKRYGELVSASKNGRIPEEIARSEGDLAKGYGQDDLKQNVYRQRALNLLGVKYILHKNENKNPDYQTFNESIYKLIWGKGGWQIYENKEALPRIFLAGDYTVEKDKDKIIQNIYDSKFDLKEKLILEEKISGDFNIRKDKKASVRVVGYQPNKIALNTESSKDNILFISDNYFNGWKASVDGVNEKIYRADYSFRAIPVKKGNHNILIWYYPESFDLGLKISIFTFFTLIIALLYSYRRLLVFKH